MERTDMGALAVESRPAEHWWHLTEWLRLGGTSGGRLVQPSAPAGPPQSCLPSTTSWQLLKISREETTTSGQPLPGLGQPQSEVPPDVQMEPPAFQFVPDASHPVPGHHCQEPGSLFSASPPRYLHTLIRAP